MFGPAGYWYVYLCYGIHWMLNVVTDEEELPAAVLIRGVGDWDGPGKLTKALAIDKRLNGKAASEKSGLWIENRGVSVRRKDVERTPRIGVDYAKHWTAKPYRFVIEGFSVPWKWRDREVVMARQGVAMQLAKLRIGTQGSPAVGLVTASSVQPLDLAGRFSSLTEMLEAANVREAVESLEPSGPRLPLDSVTLLAPIDRQEVWAAGVTYTRSKMARMEESTSAAVFYDKVYVAERPELFFKGTPHRVVGPWPASADARGFEVECAGARIGIGVELEDEAGWIHDRQRHELARY